MGLEWYDRADSIAAKFDCRQANDRADVGPRIHSAVSRTQGFHPLSLLSTTTIDYSFYDIA